MNRHSADPTRFSTRHYVRTSAPFRLPDVAETYEDLARFLHDDVAYMTPVERWAEHQAATRALASITSAGRDSCVITPTGDHIAASVWLRERIAATRG